MTVADVALAFVEAVNSGDADRLSDLMTEHHVFVDADGSEHAGREEMREGWRGYFAMVPDFRIDVEDTFARGETALMSGHASGTFVQDGVLKRENHWMVPAAWRVVVEDDRVAIWQLYVDPTPMIEIVKRMEAG
jgi:uncharacterized protein (TIGR02246 family)